MKTIGYLYLVLFLIGSILSFFAYRNYNLSRKLINKGTRTQATVIDIIEVKGDDGYTYKPVFQYTDKKQSEITFESSYSSRPATHKVGEQVQIIYNPNNDERKIVSFWGLYRWTIILLSIASPMLIIGGSYLLYIR